MKKDQTITNTPLTVGIVGVGMVGSALARYFEEVKRYRRGKNLFLYDANPRKQYQDDTNQAHIVFLCVPTPRREDGSCDTSALDKVLESLAGDKIVVIKSTVPPGTTELYQQRYPRHMFLFNPEFLTESRAWEDMIRPDRQVVGYTDASLQHASSVLNLLPTALFSSPGTLGTYTFVRVNATEAEMGKYAGNVFGALKVTYANMLADICKELESDLRGSGFQVSIDYEHIRKMLAHDHRIGDAWLDVSHNAYRGFGGACFPKDVSALLGVVRGLLDKMFKAHPGRPVFEKLCKFIEALWEYNEALLQSQGLSVMDVSMHDHEWIAKKVGAQT